MTSYYEATAERGPPCPPLRGEHETEVVVVGAGFAGLATAAGLQERGVRDVVMLEAGRVACGASGRNGGFAFGGYSLDGADLLRQLGSDAARASYGLTRDALALIRQRIVRHRIACDAVEGGALLCNWFDDDAILRRHQAVMQRLGAHWQWIGRDELAAHVVSARYFGALREADAFHFHPLKYALGLAAALVAGGGRLHEGSPAQAIETLPGGGWRVATAGGSVRARHVVVAGGGTLRHLVPRLERAMLPIATYVMVTEPLGERLREFIPSAAAIHDTRFAFDYYRVLPECRLLWGGRISVFDRAPAAIARFLKRDLARAYPALRDARVDFAWSGLMSYARHAMPQIGRLQGGRHDGLWYGLSFGGHGVAPTTVAGELLAAAIASGAALPDSCARYGLARTWRPLGLAAAQARYGWMQFKDAWRAR